MTSLLAVFLAGVLTAAGLLGLGGWRGVEPLLSPGSLARDHAGIPCRDCHLPFRGLGESSCLREGCHTRGEISEERTAFHEPSSPVPCWGCHPEHRGRGAELTLPFHATQGASYPCVRCHRTEGKEAHPEFADREDLGCHRCHPSLVTWKAVDFDHRAFSRECAFCHARPGDETHAALAGEGEKCRECHGTDSWEPARYRHDLLAAAKREDCVSCHAEEGQKAHPDITSPRCSSCHRSTERWGEVTFRHQEVTGEPCSSCHASQGRKAHPGLGDRPCKRCHLSTSTWKRVSFDHREAGGERCVACHTAPSGPFHQAARSMGCEECHSTSRWTPSTFRHPRLPEWGEHRKLGCRSCHPKDFRKAVSCGYCH